MAAPIMKLKISKPEKIPGTLTPAKVRNLRKGYWERRVTLKEVAESAEVNEQTASKLMDGVLMKEAGGPINLDLLKWPNVELSEKNIKKLREFCWSRWSAWYPEKRKYFLIEIGRLESKLIEQGLTEKETERLAYCKKKIYIKYPEPVDTSGMCMVINTLAFYVFNLRGIVVSNKHHTFVLLGRADIRTGENKDGYPVFDMNNQCRDVLGMSDPYKIDMVYDASPVGRSRVQSWHSRIVEMLPDLYIHMVG